MAHTDFSRFPIRSWLSKYSRVRDTGSKNLYADCPVCHKSAKLRVKKDTGRWNCFSCENRPSNNWRGRGSLPYLVSYLERLDVGQAIGFIRKQSGLPNEWRPEVLERQGIPATSIPLMEVPTDHKSWRVLRKRGLLHMADRVSIEVVGRYSGRFILPATYLGEVRGFEAKSYSGQFNKCLYPEWFKTYGELYTTPDWDWGCESAILTESIFDAETFRQNAIGFYGSKMTHGKLTRLLEMREKGLKNLIWAWDPDAWFPQAKAIMRMTMGLFDNWVIPLPRYDSEGKKADPNALGHETCMEYLEKAILIESEVDLMQRSLVML